MSVTRRQAAAIALGCVYASACFKYQSSAVTPVPAGENVRLELTDVGRVAVAPMAGEGVDRIDGVVDVVASDTIQLQVTALRRRDVDETWARERLRIAARDVSAVKVRRFSAVNTALLTGAIILGASAIKIGGDGSLFGGGRRSAGGATSGR